MPLNICYSQFFMHVAKGVTSDARNVFLAPCITSDATILSAF